MTDRNWAIAPESPDSKKGNPDAKGKDTCGGADRSDPAPGHFFKGREGAVRAEQVADLEAQLFQSAFGKLEIHRLERPPKVLAAPFDQSVITASRFQAVKVLCHSTKQQLAGFLSFGFQALRVGVAKSGEVSRIAESIRFRNLLYYR
jgi:hypothetical protein